LILRSLESGACRPRSRRFARRPVRLAIVALLSGAAACLSTAGAALADGEDRRIVVEPPIANPGDQLSIHGEFLWTEDTVSASIVGRAGAERSVGTATTLGNGALEMRARVPDDMPSGVYEVVVTSSSGETVSVELVIQADFPILPLLALAGAFGVVAVVALAAWRRKTGSGPAARG
jgi:hypothetical protein